MPHQERVGVLVVVDLLGEDGHLLRDADGRHGRDAPSPSSSPSSSTLLLLLSSSSLSSLLSSLLLTTTSFRQNDAQNMSQSLATLSCTFSKAKSSTKQSSSMTNDLSHKGKVCRGDGHNLPLVQDGICTRVGKGMVCLALTDAPPPTQWKPAGVGGVWRQWT